MTTNRTPVEPVPTQQPEVNGTATNPALYGLTPRHLADLRASGLSDKQIAACRFYSVRTAAAVQKALNWKGGGDKLGDCLAFPFVDGEGKPTGYCRLKPDSPRKKDGKIVKYESPKGSSNLPYFPPGILAALKDSTASLVITEGEKKAAKCDQEGVASI